MESENVRIPKWFLQVMAGIATTALVGGFGWCIWVSVTLDRWNRYIPEITALQRRVAEIGGVLDNHGREIRKLKRTKVTHPLYKEGVK